MFRSAFLVFPCRFPCLMAPTLIPKLIPTLILSAALVLPPLSPVHSQQVRPGDEPPAPSLKNPGFEDGEPGGPVSGWFASSLTGATTEVSVADPKVGTQCARMHLDLPANSKRFAVLAQPVDAERYRGKRVRFRAAVRTESGDRPFRAQLWFRVDRAGRVTGDFDNMSDRPIQNETWQYYDIVGDVAQDAEKIMVGMLVAGQGEAFLDDVSFTEVGEEVAATAKTLKFAPVAAARGTSRSSARRRSTSPPPAPKRRPLDEISPGLFEIRSANEIFRIARIAGNKSASDEVTFLLPLPLSYRDQVPLSWELSASPAESMKSVEVYRDGEHNYVARVVIHQLDAKEKVELSFASAVLVGPSSFKDVPEHAKMPSDWPSDARPWLASTWCVSSDDERIKDIGNEIRDNAGDDVMAIIRGVEGRAKETFLSAEGRVKKLTAIEALDAKGSCTSCANLVAAMLRSANVPARVLSGYPSWSGPLQTHYIVEAYVPEYGWYPVESTMCRSPWANMYQVNVAVIPPDYESQSLADTRSNVAGGVPYLSLTESPGNHGQYMRRGTIVRERACDHECQQIRQFEAEQEQWDETLRWARERWKRWVDSEPNSSDGKLGFGIAADDIAAQSLQDLMSELAD